MAVVPFCHWKLKGVVPAAVTEKVAVAPTATAWSEGCVVMVGAIAFEPLPPPQAASIRLSARQHSTFFEPRNCTAGPPEMMAISIMPAVGRLGEGHEGPCGDSRPRLSGRAKLALLTRIPIR